MKLHRIRGGTIEDLEAKAYNIGVGISLGNKWFSPENIVGLVEWSLQYTKNQVIVYVADSIHAINEEVRGRMSKQRAMTRSLKKGSEIIHNVRVLVEERFEKEDGDRVVYVTWNEIIDSKYEKKVAWLIQFFYESRTFAECIKDVVRKHVSDDRSTFSEIDIEKLSMYILHELPEVLC